jgi:hypothetical protein
VPLGDLAEELPDRGPGGCARVHGGQRAFGERGHLGERVLDDRRDQVFLRGEVPVQRADGDPCVARDVLHRRVDAGLGHERAGGLQDPVPVALCVDSHTYIMKHRSPYG